MNNHIKAEDGKMDEPKKRQRWETAVISGRISIPMMNSVLDIIDTGAYANVTDYLRDIIRADIKSRKQT